VQVFAVPRVLCVGDWHVGYSVKNEFIRILPELRRSGFTHIAFELLHADMQQQLDHYQNLKSGKNRAERKALLKHFCEIWGNYEDSSERPLLKAMAEKFVSMIDTMTLLSLKVVGIEPPVPRMFAVNNQNPDPEWPERFTAWRDTSWTESIEKVLLQEDTRVVLFSGNGHFGYNIPAWPVNSDALKFNEKLQALGYECAVLGYAGGDFPLQMVKESVAEYGCPEGDDQRLTELAMAAGLEDMRFSLCLTGLESRDSDWIVHLPREAEL